MAITTNTSSYQEEGAMAMLLYRFLIGDMACPDVKVGDFGEDYGVCSTPLWDTGEVSQGVGARPCEEVGAIRVPTMEISEGVRLAAFYEAVLVAWLPSSPEGALHLFKRVPAAATVALGPGDVGAPPLQVGFVKMQSFCG